MKGYFKYLTPGKEDTDWGLFLNVAGMAQIETNTLYPPKEHPSEYYFDWNAGRTLQEYQLIYITEGAGIFENKHGKFQLKAGSLLFIFPNEWHRYRPIKKTGWTENYVGFSGSFATQFIDKMEFTWKQPVAQCGIHEEIIDTYLKIFALVEKERPGFQQVASGMLI
jgi:hypothetical protein